MSSSIAPWEERANPTALALDEARKLIACGIPVFPCLADKRPACKQGFKDATKDGDALCQLWTKSPGVLIGVPTGDASGIFVLDIDSTKHPEANDWLDRYSPYLPETRHHRPKSGGLHFLFKHRPGLKNTAGRLAPGVDTRGDGGYIIWWPASLGLWPDHNFAALAEVPDWLCEALKPQPTISERAAVTRPARHYTGTHQIEGPIAALLRAQEGERNGLAFWAACRLAEYDDLSRNDVVGPITEAGMRVGLTARELTATANSALRTVRG